ncbi:ketopantoate reductase family protein [Sorangium sp. So ce1078]|uniref:ketopantoate reductase family protein n=1 Tax=Sorangium sp. So ce1078 TaxID=3133329 RepID=UPI003F624767
MRIAIVGPGAIGSTFAYALARAGHDVTVVARGQRLSWLQREGAIVLGSGERAEVKVHDALDASTDWDLVLVTVLAPQVAAVLPALRASAARKVMFMFNTFESIAPLREAVGAERFAFGFPGGVFALLVDGRVHPQIRRGTASSDAAWAEVFGDAGIPTVVEADMQSWLRTHAAMVVPLMAIGTIVFARGDGVSWREAAARAAAFEAGLYIVRAVGSRVRPPAIGALARLPRFVLTALLWGLSRTKMLRDLGALGTAEPRMLIDMMRAAAPALAAPLEAIRP